MAQANEKNILNKISLTGLRALVLIGLLIVKPRSIEEIKQALVDYKVLDEKSSYDILRIDLNTIKLMGCEISRASNKTGYKYVLTKHPFSLKISKDELNILKRVYNKIKQKEDLSTLIAYDELFKKISSYVFDEEIKEQLLGISVLKYYNLDTIKELILDSKQKTTLEILYQKPTSKTQEKRVIIVQKVDIKNDKLYLYCFDTEKQETRTFNLKRIVSILSRKLKKGNIDIKLIKIKFFIKNIDEEDLDYNEKIIETCENGYIVEAEYYSNFLAIQRVLSFGDKCTLLEPQEMKDKIIQKIKEMRKVYD